MLTPSIRALDVGLDLIETGRLFPSPEGSLTEPSISKGIILSKLRVTRLASAPN